VIEDYLLINRFAPWFLVNLPVMAAKQQGRQSYLTSTSGYGIL
jgi:hypothetical protein